MAETKSDDVFDSLRECPNCGVRTVVVNTREDKHGDIRRIRQCPKCGKRWVTKEELLVKPECENKDVAKEEPTIKTNAVKKTRHTQRSIDKFLKTALAPMK